MARKTTVKEPSNQLSSAEVKAKLTTMRRSAVAIEPSKRFEHVSELAGLVFDQYSPPLKVLEMEVNLAKQVLLEVRKKREFEEKKLLDIPAFLSTPPKNEDIKDE